VLIGITPENLPWLQLRKDVVSREIVSNRNFNETAISSIKEGHQWVFLSERFEGGLKRPEVGVSALRNTT